jgi:AraC family ethanolamine operon transcriptional activator
MDLPNLVANSRLFLTETIDFDRHQRVLRNARAVNRPMDLSRFHSRSGRLSLDGMDACMVETSPRRLDSTVTEDVVVFAFPLRPAPNVVVNGYELPASFMTSWGRDMTISTIEPHPGAYGALVLPMTAVAAEGIPDGRHPRIARLAEGALVQLRALLIDLFDVASRDPARFDARGAEVQAIDAFKALLSGVLAPEGASWRSRTLASHYRIARRLDERLNEAPDAALSMAELALECGASVRGLHNAIVSIRGMSPHRYIQQHRLWRVREELVRLGASTLVKEAALRHGFWHFGRFSAQYAALFGEQPSQTRARAQGS